MTKWSGVGTSFCFLLMWNGSKYKVRRKCKHCLLAVSSFEMIGFKYTKISPKHAAGVKNTFSPQVKSSIRKVHSWFLGRLGPGVTVHKRACSWAAGSVALFPAPERFLWDLSLLAAPLVSRARWCLLTPSMIMSFITTYSYTRSKPTAPPPLSSA